MLTSNKWGREINDITTWVEAFIIFSWIFCTAHSFRWQIVTQYKLLIIKTSPGKPGFTMTLPFRGIQEHVIWEIGPARIWIFTIFILALHPFSQVPPQMARTAFSFLCPVAQFLSFMKWWFPPMTLLVTFRVALHYVRPDNYHVFWSCDDVVELGLLNGTWLETCRDLSR